MTKFPFIIANCFIVTFTLCSIRPAIAIEQQEADDTAHSLQEMFTKGTPYTNFRYRYELADDDAVEKNGKASTLRSRLGFKSASLYDFKLEAEVEDVSPIGNDLYNSTINGKTDRAVIADPNSTEINQAFLSYGGIQETLVKAGRQRLVLDNHRFLGDVGWRQNDQTHDAVVISNSSLPETELLYGHSTNVNRIFSDKSPVGDFDSNINLFHIAYNGLPIGKIVGYSYLFDVKDSAALSSANFGASLVGKSQLSTDVSLPYEIEYALQQDYQDNPTQYTAHYWRALGGVTISSATLNLGYEVLGSDDSKAAFSTPFATLHRWNGWADKFLTTPVNGLQDAFTELRYAVAGTSTFLDDTTFVCAFHHFSSDEDSSTFGTEWDFEATKKISEQYSVGLKYADYNAKSFAADTQKIILSVGATFGG